MNLLTLLQKSPDPNFLVPLVSELRLSQLDAREAEGLMNAVRYGDAPEFLPLAIQASNHRSNDVRIQAVTLLSHYADDGARARLKEMLRDDVCEGVRRQAALALEGRSQLPPDLKGVTAAIVATIEDLTYDPVRNSVTITASSQEAAAVVALPMERSYLGAPADRILDIDIYLVPQFAIERLRDQVPQLRSQWTVSYEIGDRVREWAEGVRVHGTGAGVKELRFPKVLTER